MRIEIEEDQKQSISLKRSEIEDYAEDGISRALAVHAAAKRNGCSEKIAERALNRAAMQSAWSGR